MLEWAYPPLSITRAHNPRCMLHLIVLLRLHTLFFLKPRYDFGSLYIHNCCIFMYSCCVSNDIICNVEVKRSIAVQWILTDLRCLAASSQICIPLDSFTSTEPRYCKGKTKINLNDYMKSVKQWVVTHVTLAAICWLIHKFAVG